MKNQFFDAIELQEQPLSEASTIPSSWYTSSMAHDVDRQHVLFNEWQYVGAASQVDESGGFLTASIAGNPIIVVRDTDGSLKGFYNVCKHRGGPLETEPCGKIRMLQCKYHGWTYKLDGSLRGVPRFGKTDLFDKKDFGLQVISVDIWHGLVFAKLGDADHSLEDHLAGIANRVRPMDPATLTYYNRVVYDVKCNWKVYVDSYLEGYHLPLVHPELCDAISYADYITETFDTYSLQHSSFRDESEDRAYYYFVFPNTMLNILPGRLQVNTILPRSKNTTRVIFDYFYDDVSSLDAAHSIEADQTFADKVQQEDIDICEHVQRGLESVAYDKGRFSAETEAGVHHFQSLLKRSYASFVSSLKSESNS